MEDYDYTDLLGYSLYENRLDINFLNTVFPQRPFRFMKNIAYTKSGNVRDVYYELNVNTDFILNLDFQQVYITKYYPFDITISADALVHMGRKFFSDLENELPMYTKGNVSMTTFRPGIVIAIHKEQLQYTTYRLLLELLSVCCGFEYQYTEMNVDYFEFNRESDKEELKQTLEELCAHFQENEAVLYVAKEDVDTILTLIYKEPFNKREYGYYFDRSKMKLEDGLLALELVKDPNGPLGLKSFDLPIIQGSIAETSRLRFDMSIPATISWHTHPPVYGLMDMRTNEFLPQSNYTMLSGVFSPSDMMIYLRNAVYFNLVFATEGIYVCYKPLLSYSILNRLACYVNHTLWIKMNEELTAYFNSKVKIVLQLMIIGDLADGRNPYFTYEHLNKLDVQYLYSILEDEQLLNTLYFTIFAGYDTNNVYKQYEQMIKRLRQFKKVIQLTAGKTMTMIMVEYLKVVFMSMNLKDIVNLNIFNNIFVVRELSDMTFRNVFSDETIEAMVTVLYANPQSFYNYRPDTRFNLEDPDAVSHVEKLLIDEDIVLFEIDFYTLSKITEQGFASKPYKI